MANNNIKFQGNAGINYHFNRFHIGIALPKLFQSVAPSQTEFGQLKFKPTNSLVANATYRFGNEKVAFEPHIIYRRNDNLITQFEGVGIVYLNNMFWFGGSYRQNYGLTALIGLKVKDRFKFGYAYEIPSSKTTEIGNSSHEFLLSIIIGKKKKVISKAEDDIQKVDALEVVNEDAVSKKKSLEEKEKSEASSKKPVPPDSLAPTDYVKKGTREVNQLSGKEETIKLKPKKYNIEADKGVFVVIGAFRMYDNALKYQKQMKEKGTTCLVFYSSQTLYYYTYLLKAKDIYQARKERNIYRQWKEFEDAWILIVE